MTRSLTPALLSVAVAIAAASSAATAAIPIVNAGILMGATGVTIGSKTYDVTFREGTCAGVYGTCGNTSFDFTSLDDASAAAQALLDQVFIDSAWGLFDSNPQRTFGCSDSATCASIVAYNIPADSDFVLSVVSANSSREAADGLVGNVFNKGSDTSTISRYNYARFTLVGGDTGAVPEPATWAMMTLGFGAVGFAMRRKQAVTRIRFA